MRVSDASALIEPAIVSQGGAWADLGAGTGTFTQALSGLLGSGGRVYAVERDPDAVVTLERSASANRGDAEILPIHADFTGALELPRLDGIVLANAIHFVPVKEQAPLLRRLVGHLRPDGRLVLVEYDRESGNRWVPYPVSVARLETIARDAGLTSPMVVGRRPSNYGGSMYAAWLAPLAASR